jgi:hypothetical protein
METVLFVIALSAAQTTPGTSSGNAAKIEIVSVAGCLKEAAPNAWTIVNATDPVPSNANAPAAKDIPAAPPVGKNEFRLIGVSEFNLPPQRDKSVIVKGLFIKATPMSRLNVTSVTTIAQACPPALSK